MVAVAIFSIDPILRRNLEQLPHDDPAFALVGDHPSSVPELLNQYRIDVLLADAPTRELLAAGCGLLAIAASVLRCCDVSGGSAWASSATRP